MADPGGGGSADRPAGPVGGGDVVRRLVVAVVVVEAALLAAGAVYLVVETAVASPADRAGSAFLVLVVLALTAGLVAVARGLAAGRRWSRAPALVWQLIQALVGFQFAQGAAAQAPVRWQWAVAVPLIVAAGVVCVGVLRPGVITQGAGEL